MNDHELEPILIADPTKVHGVRGRSYRHYMVGKLVRVDDERPEIGFKQPLCCACHNEPLVVIGPRAESPRYSALCVFSFGASDNHIVPLVTGTTMEELWNKAQALTVK